MNIFTKIVDLFKFKIKEGDPKYSKLLRELMALPQPLLIKKGRQVITLDLELRGFSLNTFKGCIESTTFYIDAALDDNSVIIFGRTVNDNFYKIYIDRSTQNCDVCNVHYKLRGVLTPFGQILLTPSDI